MEKNWGVLTCVVHFVQLLAERRGGKFYFSKTPVAIQL